MNNEPDYDNNLAFDTQTLKEVDETKKLRKLLNECYLLISHFYMPTITKTLLISLREELGYDKKSN